MPASTVPPREAERLRVLHELGVLDSPPEPAFDALVKAAALICQAPVALVCFVDQQRLWFKANHGMEGISELPRKASFCAEAMLREEALEVGDAASDPRFASSPLVTGTAGVRFYAGVPLAPVDGVCIGTFCILDKVPRQLEPEQRQALQMLAGVVTDALRSRLSLRELSRDRDRCRELGEASPLGVFATDSQGVCTFMNKRCREIISEPQMQFISDGLARSVHPDDEHLATSEWLPFSGSGQAFDMIYRVRCRSGKVTHVRALANAVYDERNRFAGFVGVLEDVTEQQKLVRDMRYRAQHDMLTGLLNRTEFEARLQLTLDEVRADRGEYALLVLDLDQFKLVNDACGHAAGDTLLQQVAGKLKEFLQPSDLLFRLGGDEFGIIIRQQGERRAALVAQQICDGMDDFRFLHEQQHFRIGASIGLVLIDARWPDVASLLQAADSSCYAAKDAGRNRVHIWFDTDSSLHLRKGELQWASRLERALDGDLFALYAQTIKPLAGGEDGLHVEVLLRLEESGMNPLLPEVFLPLAERFHYVPHIDRWVLNRALQFLSAMPDLDRLGCLYLNVAGQSIRDPAFRREALQILQFAGPELCSRLCFDIAEVVAMTALPDTTAFIREVRALGVRVAIDGFGAGASAFGSLRNLEVDAIKIDGQFVRGLDKDPLNSIAVRSFVDAAAILGLTTVASHIERPDVLEQIGALGVDYAQGNLLHGPAPIRDVLPA